jgi:hypothetical protein
MLYYHITKSNICNHIFNKYLHYRDKRLYLKTLSKLMSCALSWMFFVQFVLAILTIQLLNYVPMHMVQGRHHRGVLIGDPVTKK